MRPLLQRHLLCSTPSPAALRAPSCLPTAPGDLGVLILPAHSSWCLAGGMGVGDLRWGIGREPAAGLGGGGSRTDGHPWGRLEKGETLWASFGITSLTTRKLISLLNSTPSCPLAAVWPGQARDMAPSWVLRSALHQHQQLPLPPQ